MSCKVNFLKSSGISNSEFNQLLLFKGLFDEFMSHYNNVTGEDGKGLAKFENEYLSESVRKEFEQYIKDLRTFKRTGKIDNPSSEDFITFVVNNNLNSSVLIDLRDRFIKDFFVFVNDSNLYLEKGKDPDFLRVIPSDYSKHFEIVDGKLRPIKGGDNLIMNFLTYTQTSYLKGLELQLKKAIESNNDEQIFVNNIAINFVKSLRLNQPVVSKQGLSGMVISEENIKNNPNLKLLLEFLYEPFPVTIVENKQGLTEEDTEGNREIYEKNPVQVDPFDKVSPFIKMLMAGISKDVNQDSSFGKNFWNPTEFAVMMLEEFHKDGDFSVKNFTDKLSKLEDFANKNKSVHPKYQSIATFIDRYRIIEGIHKDNPDKLNDLKVDLQNWLQNINVNYRMVKSKKFSGRTYYPTYLSDSSKDKVKTVNNVQKNLEELLFNLNETYRSTNRVLTSEKFAEEVKAFLAFNYLKSDIDLKGIFEKNNNKLINDNGTEINKKLINDIVNEENLLADFFSHEAVNVEGESIYPVVRPSFLTETVSKINRSIQGVDKSFIEDLENTYMENSIFFDYAENEFANNNLLEISINNGIDIEQKNTKVKYTSYKSDELVSFLLNTYLNINYASDKIGPTPNKSYNLMGGIPADAQNVFSIDNFNNLNEILDIQFDKHFKNFKTILEQEQPNINTFAKNRMIMLLNLIKTDLDLFENNNSVKNGISKNVNEAFKNGKTLILANFDDVLGSGTNNRVIELFELIQNGNGTKESFDELEQILKLYQTNLIKRDINSLIETGLVEKVDEKVDGENTLKLNDDTNLFSNKIKESKTFTKDLQNALFYYYFLTTQTNMLTSGHPAFYKAGDMTKRNKSPFSNTTRPFIEASEKVGDEIITIPEKIRTIVINDIEEYLDPESEFGKHLLKSLEENFDKQNIGKEDDKDYEIKKDRFLTKQMSNLFSNYTDSNDVKMYVLPKYIKDGKVEANAIMEKSKITNTTDAASIVSPIMKQYLNIAFNENSDSQKQFYLAEKKGGKGRNIPEKHGNNTVMKNFVFTHHNKVNAMIVKTSQANFDGQLVFMGGKINYTYAAIGTLMGYEFDFKNKTYKYNPNKAKVEQIVFASTLKATTPNSKEDKNPDENKSVVKDISEASEMLKNDNTSFVKNYESDVIEIDFWDNTKQQDTPEHLEDRGDVGTQLMKLVYYAVDPTGEYKVGNETLSGKQVVEKINDILIEINKRNVENFTKNTINSKNFFHELILELYSSRKELDIMSVDEEKVEELLKNPVFAAELLPKVMAKLKQELLKVKLNTFSAYNGVIPGDDSLEIKVEDDKVVFEIALPLTNMELYELLLEEDGTINIDKKDENNNFIYPQELRERIVYRIPTEAIYSTFVVRVKHFTHPTAGAIAYMPKGTTTMAGFDMDIDKLFGFMKNYKIIKKTDKDKNTKVVGVKYKDYNDDEQNFNDYFWKNLSEEDADDIFQMKDVTKDIQSEIDTINKQLEDLKKEVNDVVDRRIKDENLDESRKKEIFKKTLYEETNYEGLKEQRIKLVKDITGSKSTYSKELQAYREKYRETFNALSELEKIDNDGLENYLIDLYTTIISNKASMTELSTGNNADRQDRHAKEMSSGKKKSADYKMANISEQVDSHKAIMTGKENISIGASKNSGIALLQQMYILLDGEAIFNYSGTTMVRQSDFVTNNLDVNGNKINLSIASILAQAVDNIKNPVAELINYYPNLLSNHIFLYTLGLDPEIVDRLFTWGKINTLIKDGFKNNRLSTNVFIEDFTLNAEENEKYDEFLDSNNMLDLSKLKELKFSEIGVDEDFDKYMQRKGISPESIIGLLNHISADSGKIGGFISALNLIDKGLGSNLNEILKNLEIIENAIGNTTGEQPYINYKVRDSYSFTKLLSMKDQTEFLLRNKLNIDINSDNLKTIFKKFEELQIRVSSRKGKVYEHVQSLNYLFNKLGINSIEDITKLEDYFTTIQDDINDVESILKSSDNNSISELRLLKNILFIKNVDSNNKNVKKFDFIPTNVAGLYNFDHLRTGKVLHFKTIHPAYNNVKNPKSILDTMSLITSKTLKYTDKNGNLQTMTYRDFVSLLYKINEFQALTVKKESSKELSNAFTKLFLDNLIIQADNNVLENLTRGDKTIEEAGEDMSIFASNILGKTLFETMLFNNPDFLKAASIILDSTTKYVNKNLKFVQSTNNKKKLELNEDIFKLANILKDVKRSKDPNNKLWFNNVYFLVDVKKGFKLKPYVVIGLSNGNETFNFITRVETPDDPNEAQYKRLVIIGNLEGKSVFSQAYNYNLLILQNKVESNTSGIEEADVLSSTEDNVPFVQSTKPVQQVIDFGDNKVGGNKTANNIYSQLGNKTKSENVILPKDLGLKYVSNPNNFWSEIEPAFRKEYPNGLVAFRGKNTDFNIGNPFNWQSHGVGKATNMFIDWILTGNNYNEVAATETLRQDYLSKIKKSKVEKILYYSETGTPTHATALDYLINKYNWSGNETAETPTNTNPKDFTNHSGGAYGGDTFWDLIGREFGVTNHRHYKDSGNANLSQQLRNKGVKAEILTKEQMDFARQKVKELLGIEYKDDLKGNLQVRNFYQVYNTDAVYAIAKIKDDNQTVSGGTNTAVQLGIKLNKPVYVWDINSEQWYQWNPNASDTEDSYKGGFEEYYELDSEGRITNNQTPKLTKNFAGVGSRDIENYNVQKDGKWQPREEYVGKEKEEKAKQAIRDVYENTIKTPTTEQVDNKEVKIRYEKAINSFSLERINKLLNLDNKNADSIEKARKWLENEFNFLFNGDTNYIDNFIYNASKKGVQNNFDSALEGDTQKEIDYATEYSLMAKEISEFVINNNIDNKDTYQYFGANYTIVLDENNKGIDIENYSKNSSETQTKFQERKQKLLNDYNNNPNVDPQNGKPFRNVSNQNNLLSTNIENIKPKFSYKGTTIDTEFELTNQQRQALERLIDFTTEESYESKDWKDNGITLNGFAGTGKTSVIGYLQKYLKSKNSTVKINYLAPTHAATTELAFSTVKTGNNKFPQTVASALGKTIDYKTGLESIVIRKKLADRLNPYGDNILVIDELSMLNSEDYNSVKTIATRFPNIKIIFMGDPLQIPEVTEGAKEKEISKGFNEVEQVNLTEVKRTKDNDILEVLTALRNNVNSLIPVVKNTSKLQYLDTFSFNKTLSQKFKEDPENTIFISYTKASVSSANKNIREGVLGITGDLKEGEVITGYLGYQSKQVELGHLANSVRYTVSKIHKKGSEYVIVSTSEKLKELERLGMDVPNGSNFTYLQLSTNDSLKFSELNDSDFEKNNKKLSEMFKNINDLQKAALNKQINWNVYYTKLEELTKEMAIINLGDNYIYNPKTDRMEKYNGLDEHKKIKKDHSALYVEKGVDFGYAVNTHKSQGQTIKNVFYSTSDLPSGNVATLKLNGKFFGYEKHSLNYVAMSRASENLYVLKENDNQFYNLNNNTDVPPCI